MNINLVNNSNIYSKNPVESQAKLPTGAAAQETVKAFEKVITNVVSPMSSTDVKKTMNGISEGISSVEEQLRADAQAAKANLKALFNKLSGAEAEKLSEDGFDINDIDDEELVTVVDRIKIMLSAYNENYQAFADAFDVEGSKELEENVGNLAAKVAAKLNESYMPATEENVTDVMSTIQMANDISTHMPLSDEAKAYMLDNELKPTIGNVYKANHSIVASQAVEQLPPKQWEQIRPQVDKIIENARLLKSEDTYSNAKWLIVNELPVTEDNLVMKKKLDELDFEFHEDEVITAAVEAMADGRKPEEVLLTGDINVWKKAAVAIGVVNTVSERQIDGMVKEGRRCTIEEMLGVMGNSVAEKSHDAEDQNSAADDNVVMEFTAKSQAAIKMVYEARILMTANSTVSLINRGIDIYTEDLSNLVELLRQEETRYINEQLTKANAGNISEEDFAQVSAVNQALFELKFAPCAAIGRMVNVEAALTITSVHSISTNMQRQYDQAGQAYETMSTKARGDMGDSVAAALRNSSESILEELGLDTNETNLRAVRILAYNSMEMSVENVHNIRNVDSILNSLMDNMQPQVVYDMIKAGINPMETDIATLNQYINDNYVVQDETVKYSEFLYKLEHTEGISEEDRSRFIGIYKVFNTIKKDGGKAVGALINQDAEINLKNLVTAVNSRKRYDMDVTLSVETGMAQVTGQLYYENLFAKMAKGTSPSALKQVDAKWNIDEMSVERLAEELEEAREADREFAREYFAMSVEEAKKYQDAEDSVIRLLTDNSQPVTFYNIMAAGELMKGDGFYKDLRQRRDDRVNHAMDRIFEALDNGDELSKAYEELSKSVLQGNNEALLKEGEDSFVDINQLKNQAKTVNLISALSNRQQYFVPFMTEDGVGTINLKIVNTQVNMGKMQMSFATENLGSVYVEMQVSEIGATGYIVSDYEEGVNLIRENVDNIKDALEKLGISRTGLRVALSKDVPAVSLHNEGDGVSSALLYRTAKAILTNLIEVKTN